MVAPGRNWRGAHTELDGLSLSREEIGTDHLITVAAISAFAPSRDADNSLALFQIVISRIQQLAQSDALRKRAATKRVYLRHLIVSVADLSLANSTHISLIISFLVVGCKFAETGESLNG